MRRTAGTPERVGPAGPFCPSMEAENESRWGLMEIDEYRVGEGFETPAEARDIAAPTLGYDELELSAFNGHRIAWKTGTHNVTARYGTQHWHLFRPDAPYTEAVVAVRTGPSATILREYVAGPR